MLMEAKPLFLLCLLLLLLLLECPTNAGFRIGLTHVDSKNNNMGLAELVKGAVHRSKHRMALVQAKLSTNSTFDVQAPIHYGDNNVAEYYMDFSIGTPPVPITAVMDTGSDLVWTQCEPCVQCVPQNTAIYDPSNSSTFSVIPCAAPLCQSFAPDPSCNSAQQCSFTASYADNSTTKGVLGYETFALGDSSIDNIGFGCSHENADSPGIVGLGQGNASLPSQLSTGRFSYCLSMVSNNSLVLLGPSASLDGSSTGTVQSTPFLSDTRWYFVSLQGISLGETLLPIPNTTFQYNANGTGGTIIDSGASLTFLQQSAYDILRQEIVSMINLPVIEVNNSSGPDLCFQVASWPPPSMPDMTLHFDGADMTVPPENYILSDEGSGTLCLLIMPTDDLNTSILGNYLQQNIHILYDLDNRVLSFVPAQCDQL